MSERIFITMEEPTASVNALRVTVIVMLVILYRSAIKGAFTSNYVAILYWAVIESHRTVLHHNTPCHAMPRHATPRHATSCHIMPHHATSCHLAPPSTCSSVCFVLETSRGFLEIAADCDATCTCSTKCQPQPKLIFYLSEVAWAEGFNTTTGPHHHLNHLITSSPHRLTPPLPSRAFPTPPTAY